MCSIFHFRDLLARHMSKMPLLMHHAISGHRPLCPGSWTALYNHSNITRRLERTLDPPPDLILSSDVKADLFRSVSHRFRWCDSYTQRTHVSHMSRRLHNPAYRRFTVSTLRPYDSSGV